MTFNPTQPRESDGRFGSVHRGDPGQLGLDSASGAYEAVCDAVSRATRFESTVTLFPDSGGIRVVVEDVEHLGAETLRSIRDEARAKTGDSVNVNFPGTIDERVVDEVDHAMKALDVRANADVADEIHQRLLGLVAPGDPGAQDKVSEALRDGIDRDDLTAWSTGCLSDDPRFQQEAVKSIKRAIELSDEHDDDEFGEYDVEHDGELDDEFDEHDDEFGEYSNEYVKNCQYVEVRSAAIFATLGHSEDQDRAEEFIMENVWRGGDAEHVHSQLLMFLSSRT